MNVDILKVADYFISLAGAGIVPMKLQRLVYFAHGWHLAIHKSPLFLDAVLAAEWGLKIPRLDEELSRYGNGLILRPISDDFNPSRLPPETRDLLDCVWREYKRFSDREAAALTLHQGTPWYQTRSQVAQPAEPEIRRGLITDHYLEIAFSRN